MTEDEIAQSNFDKLIENLITISLPANRQKDIVGFGGVADELVTDFDAYYSLTNELYVDRGWLNDTQLHELKCLDNFFYKKTAEKDSDFWDDDKLQENPDWEYVRSKAKEILRMLGKDNLNIEFERTIEYIKSGKGEPIVIERTFIKLVKERSS